MKKPPIIIANWKGYIETSDDAKKFAVALKRRPKLFSFAEVMIAPSYTLVPALVPLFIKSKVKVGAQTVSASAGGAHTGDVTALMLKSVGASFVIVGHSERRFGAPRESEDMVHEQLLRASDSGLGVVLCVGEQERDPGGAHFAAIAQEITSALAGLSQKALAKLIIAYEPVWAIGKTAADAMRPGDAEEMVIFIRKTLASVPGLGREGALKVPILYGGSVEEENVAQLYKESGVAGFLVGHASAQIDSFSNILQALQESK